MCEHCKTLSNDIAAIMQETEDGGELEVFFTNEWTQIAPVISDSVVDVFERLFAAGEKWAESKRMPEMMALSIGAGDASPFPPFPPNMVLALLREVQMRRAAMSLEDIDTLTI